MENLILMSYNYVKKGGTVMREYKGALCELINKIDKKDARPLEVVDMTFNLFMELNATDEQLDFPIVYGIAKEGIAKLSLDSESNNIEPLLETILKQVEPFKGNEKGNLAEYCLYGYRCAYESNKLPAGRNHSGDCTSGIYQYQ